MFAAHGKKEINKKLGQESPSGKILVHQQLSAHYRKIQNVKSTVRKITRCNPKTEFTTRRCKTAELCHYKSEQPFRTAELLKIDTFSDDPLVDEIVKSYLVNSYRNFGEPECIDNSQWKKLSNKCRTSFQSRNFKKCYGSDCGDVLLTHKDKFTSEKPFSPRTIKSNATSKLRALRCYNPPVRAVKMRTRPRHDSSKHGTETPGSASTQNIVAESSRKRSPTTKADSKGFEVVNSWLQNIGPNLQELHNLDTRIHEKAIEEICAERAKESGMANKEVICAVGKESVPTSPQGEHGFKEDDIKKAMRQPHTDVFTVEGSTNGKSVECTGLPNVEPTEQQARKLESPIKKDDGQNVHSSCITALPPRVPSREARSSVKTPKRFTRCQRPSSCQSPESPRRLVQAMQQENSDSDELLLAHISPGSNDTDKLPLSPFENLVLDSWPQTEENDLGTSQLSLGGEDTLNDQTSLANLSSPWDQVQMNLDGDGQKTEQIPHDAPMNEVSRTGT